jgi:starch-binding outer membrane protein, SusD/RagB family
MKSLINRAGRATTATAVVVGGLFLGACSTHDELLAPQNPGVISPASTANTAAADALYVGALGRWKGAINGSGSSNTESLWNWEALFTDEDMSGDTFSQRDDADQRNSATNDAVLTPIYAAVQQARGFARSAINGLLANDKSALGVQHVGEMYFQMGYLEMILNEAFCNGVPLGETVNGVPQYTPPLTNAQGFAVALSRLDTALTYLTATDATTQGIKNAVLITRARIKVDQGNFSGAVAEVAGVATSSQYNFDFSITTVDNEWWILGASVKRYEAGDSTNVAGQIFNAIPFARLNDPRVSVTNTHSPSEDNVTNFVQVNNWGRDDPIPVVSGIDARLIEAEARLQANDINGMMTILNALRTSPQVLGIFKIAAMPALATPPDQTTATNLFFREKALWQFQRGYRMSDLRRLVRQYGRTQDQVFPNGAFTRNGAASGVYGTEVAFPVPDAEKANPNFTGCLDTKA